MPVSYVLQWHKIRRAFHKLNKGNKARKEMKIAIRIDENEVVWQTGKLA
jgi:hypothetical protein